MAPTRNDPNDNDTQALIQQMHEIQQKLKIKAQTSSSSKKVNPNSQAFGFNSNAFMTQNYMDDPRLQKDLNTIDLQSKNFVKKLINGQGNLQLDKFDNEFEDLGSGDEADQQILLQHQRQVERKKKFAIEQAQTRKKA